MEPQTTIEFINTVGFPIAVCIALFWFIRDTLKKHQNLMEQFNNSINLNTETIKLLVQKLSEK